MSDFDVGATPWLVQRDGSCCVLYALCNAARALGISTPAPGDAEWERLVDLACCRYGAALDVHGIARRLGLRLVAFEGAGRGKRPMVLPTVLTTLNPVPGMTLHASLCVAQHNGALTLIGYRVGGPVVEHVPCVDVRWAPPSTCRALMCGGRRR